MSIPYTKASEISAELFARMQGITVANGAETDTGLRVYRGRRNVDETQVPCAVVIEGNDTLQDVKALHRDYPDVYAKDIEALAQFEAARSA